MGHSEDEDAKTGGVEPTVSAVVVPMSRKHETWGTLSWTVPSEDNTRMGDLGHPPRASKEYPFFLFESIIGNREGIMHRRQLRMFLVLTAFISCIAIYPLPARSSTSQESNSTQTQNKEDQKKPADTGKLASGSQAKEPASGIKSAPTDEGQLATINNAKIPSYSKVYVAPIAGGFENYIIAGLRNKKVPLTVVMDRSKADYEISGVSDSEKAGWAKMLFIGSQNSNEQASIKISDLRTGEVIFGYSVHKTNSVRGKQSAGEACAKHIKQIVLD
jgi:hypothetical protein